MRQKHRAAGRAGRLWYKDKLIVIVLAAAVIVIFSALLGVLAFRSGINAYKNQIRFLDPSWMCVAKHQGTEVVLAGDNHRKLINVLERCHRKVVRGEPEIVDTVHFTFAKDGVRWEMEISQTDRECLKMDLVGEEEYHVYIPEENYFETIVELAGPDGKGTPNKAVVVK